jgi:hypothetical protein
MSAKAATIQNNQINPGRRRFLDLDLLVKVAVPLLLLFFLIIALQMESFGSYARLFRRNTYTTFLGFPPDAGFVSLLPHLEREICQRHGPSLFLSNLLLSAAGTGCRLGLRGRLFLLCPFSFSVGLSLTPF